jgi:hypothetical protein
LRRGRGRGLFGVGRRGVRLWIGVPTHDVAFPNLKVLDRFF